VKVPEGRKQAGLSKRSAHAFGNATISGAERIREGVLGRFDAALKLASSVPTLLLPRRPSACLLKKLLGLFVERKVSDMTARQP
jgi:hypothetical protein